MAAIFTTAACTARPCRLVPTDIAPMLLIHRIRVEWLLQLRQGTVNIVVKLVRCVREAFCGERVN